ncbi:MAG: hypothetical protein HC884_03475 [Chloroflexaceae bacterium]|nr:hypothetical protein [Chloroflexaceae bacterium]
MRLVLDAPAGTGGEVVLPPMTSGRIRLNGTVVWEHGSAQTDQVVTRPDGLYLFLGSGQITLEVWSSLPELEAEQEGGG